MGRAIPVQPWSGEDNARLWSKLVLGDTEVPGVAKVRVKRANKWERKKAKGQHGGGRNFAGADDAEIEIEIRMLSSEEEADFNRVILPIIEPTPGKEKPEAILLGHPVAVIRKVKAITIDDVDGPDTSNGIITYRIKATEFREPDKKNASGAVKGGGGRRAALSADCSGLKGQLESLAREYNLALQENVRLHAYRNLIVEEVSSYEAAVRNSNLVTSDADRAAGLQGEASKNQQEIQANEAYVRSLQEQMNQAGAEMSRLGCTGQPPSSNPQVTGQAA